MSNNTYKLNAPGFIRLIPIQEGMPRRPLWYPWMSRSTVTVGVGDDSYWYARQQRLRAQQPKQENRSSGSNTESEFQSES